MFGPTSRSSPPVRAVFPSSLHLYLLLLRAPAQSFHAHDPRGQSASVTVSAFAAADARHRENLKMKARGQTAEITIEHDLLFKTTGWGCRESTEAYILPAANRRG